MPLWFKAYSRSSRDKVEDFLGKGNHEAARQGEETLRTLGGIVALEGEADLHHAPAQKDEADGADQGKDKVGQVVHHAQRIAGGEGRDGKAAEAQHCGCVDGKAEPPLFTKRQGVCGLIVLFGIFLQNKAIQGFLQKHSSSSKCIFMGLENPPAPAVQNRRTGPGRNRYRLRRPLPACNRRAQRRHLRSAGYWGGA